MKSIFRIFILICCLFISSASYYPAVLPWIYKNNIKIKTMSGKTPIVLSANLYLPKDATRSGKKFPAIIFSNSWGFDEYEFKQVAQNLARHGYIVLSYSARGWGNSTGLVDAGGPDDMQDIHKIINWLEKNTLVDKNHIGMAGLSYSAGMALLAAEHDSRIKAVAAMSGWSDLYHSLYYNQTPSVRVGEKLKEIAKMKNASLSPALTTHMNSISTYKISPKLIRWAAERSPNHFINKLNQNQTAVYLSNNLQDTLFSPEDMLYFYQHLSLKHKYLRLNQGIHTSAESGGLFGKKNEIWEEVIAWFDRYLKGVKNNLSNDIKVVVDNQKKKINFPSTLHFSQINLAQAKIKPPVGKIIYKGIDGFNAGAPRFVFFDILKMRKAFRTGKVSPTYLSLYSIKKCCTFFYLFNEVMQNTLILGNPQLSLWIKIIPNNNPLPSSISAQIIAYLYDYNPATKQAKLISFAPYTFYQAKTYFNQWQFIQFYLRLTAYKILKGHSLALGIGTDDYLYKSDASQWNGGIQINNELKGRASVLILPVNDLSTVF